MCPKDFKKETLNLHPPQKAPQIKLLLIPTLIPQLPQIIQPPLLPLLLHLPRRIHHILFPPLPPCPTTTTTVEIGVGRCGEGGRVGDVEEVEDLVRFHGGEPGVLLVDDCGGDVDFETLETIRGDGGLAGVDVCVIRGWRDW